MISSAITQFGGVIADMEAGDHREIGTEQLTLTWDKDVSV